MTDKDGSRRFNSEYINSTIEWVKDSSLFQFLASSKELQFSDNINASTSLNIR